MKSVFYKYKNIEENITNTTESYEIGVYMFKENKPVIGIC